MLKNRKIGLLDYFVDNKYITYFKITSKENVKAKPKPDFRLCIIPMNFLNIDLKKVGEILNLSLLEYISIQIELKNYRNFQNPSGLKILWT